MAQLHIRETIETADFKPRTDQGVQLEVTTDIFGTIKALFDSGASINCIDMAYAYKYHKKHIQIVKEFYVRTGNGTIIVNRCILTQITCSTQDIPFPAKWYLLANTPYTFIGSRSLFHQIGYNIVNPDGHIISLTTGEFINTAYQEKLSADLYEDLIKQIDYPLPDKYADPVEFIQYLQDFNQRQYTQPTLFKDVCIYDVCVIEFEMTVITTDWTDMIQKLTEHIATVDICIQVVQLLRDNINRYAANMADIGTLPGEEFEINLKPGAIPRKASHTPIHSNIQGKPIVN